MMKMIWKIDINEIELQKARIGVGSRVRCFVPIAIDCNLTRFFDDNAHFDRFRTIQVKAIHDIHTYASSRRLFADGIRTKEYKRLKNLYKMSRCIRQPTICKCENKGTDQLRLPRS